MKLRTRLAATLGVALVVSGVLIGGATAWLSRSNEIHRIDDLLGGITAKISADPNNDVETLLGAVGTTPIPIIGEIYFADTDPFTVVEGVDGSKALLLPKLSQATVNRAIEQPLTVDGLTSLRIRATASGEGQWIVIGTSLRDVNKQFIDSLLQSLLVSAGIALIAVFVTWFALRRELHPITQITESATAIASGDLGVELPVSARTNEVGELTSALRAMTNELQAAVTVTSLSEQRMREFLGDASHELRTPLTVVRGYVDILFSGQELSDEQRERAIRRLKSESKRMDVIINDLLLLAELGEVNQDKVDVVDLSEMVTDHVRDLTAQQPQRRVSSTVATDVQVQGNSEQIERILSNLMSNIVRHTNTDADVGVSLVEQDGVAILVVDDAGPGLSPEMYARSSEGFQRFDRAHSQSGGGFGLGLSILSSIVQRHGGVLTMSHSPLGGLRTSVTIPM
ncbi:MAG: sensor histidine kinase [Actinobacteria bacterium]|nr:MAG: sensor histidine kinase [Actinomycetota bacterium]